MGFYFKKSKNITKNTKLNFSKSGIGISTGVKGARVGVSSKGQIYTQVGKNGIYYRKNFGSIAKILKLIIKFFK